MSVTEATFLLFIPSPSALCVLPQQHCLTQTLSAAHSLEDVDALLLLWGRFGQFASVRK